MTISMVVIEYGLRYIISDSQFSMTNAEILSLQVMEQDYSSKMMSMSSLVLSVMPVCFFYYFFSLDFPLQ